MKSLNQIILCGFKVQPREYRVLRPFAANSRATRSTGAAFRELSPKFTGSLLGDNAIAATGIPPGITAAMGNFVPLLGFALPPACRPARRAGISESL